MKPVVGQAVLWQKPGMPEAKRGVIEEIRPSTMVISGEEVASERIWFAPITSKRPAVGPFFPPHRPFCYCECGAKIEKRSASHKLCEECRIKHRQEAWRKNKEKRKETK